MFLVTQSCLTLCDPKDCSPPGSSVHGILQARIMDGMACPPPWDLPNPGTESRSPSLQADSLPSEPPGKSINTVMGSLSLLQGIFPTQGPNPGLLHCRQILYCLSHQGSITDKFMPKNISETVHTTDVSVFHGDAHSVPDSMKQCCNYYK